MKYKKGDILTHEDFKDRKILSVVDELYFISRRDHRLSEIMYTEYELDELGYTLKSRPKEDWTPNYGDFYYYVSGWRIDCSRYTGDSEDEARKESLGVFPTYGEAQERFDKIKEFVKTL